MRFTVTTIVLVTATALALPAAGSAAPLGVATEALQTTARPSELAAGPGVEDPAAESPNELSGEEPVEEFPEEPPVSEEALPEAAEAGESPAQLTASRQAETGACSVPRLAGKTLAAAVVQLRRADCKLGRVVRGRPHHRSLVVVAQSIAPGKKLRAGARVGLRLGRAKPKN